MDKNDLGNWLEKYYAEFMMKSGAPEAMIYTRAGWFDYEMPLTNTFWRCLLWVADYTPPVSVPKEWSNHNRTYTLHQKGIYKPGSDYGCPEPPLAAAGIDLTDFPGTASQFQDVFGVLPNPLPTTPPPTVGTRVRTKVAINPRTAPRIETATDAGNINAGFTFKKAGEPQNGFQPVEVWLAQAYLTELP